MLVQTERGTPGGDSGSRTFDNRSKKNQTHGRFGSLSGSKDQSDYVEFNLGLEERRPRQPRSKLYMCMY